MPDLHAWITAKVDATETAAHKGYAFKFVVNGSAQAITGTATPPAPLAISMLRRCEADRRILARHRIDPDSASTDRATACDGCGVEWVQDYCDPFTDNINDCPELLNLAYAHGITREELAALDRPQPPELSTQAPKRQRGVPETLRGPGWRSAS